MHPLTSIQELKHGISVQAAYVHLRSHILYSQAARLWIIVRCLCRYKVFWREVKVQVHAHAQPDTSGLGLNKEFVQVLAGCRDGTLAKHLL